MTENKRFIFVDNFSSDEAGMDILDKYTNKRYNEYHMGKVLDFLNELNDVYEELKNDYKTLQLQYDNLNEYRKELHDENEELKQEKKSQELEIVRLHNLADSMSSVLRELGIYDVYNKEQIKKVKEYLE